MNLSLLKRIVNRALATRGLRLAPKLCYGSSQATDIKKLWQDLDLPHPQTIVDIGSNKGLFSKEIKKHFPGSRVIAIEANCDLIESIKHFKGFENIEVIHAAIGDTCKPVKLNIYTIDGLEDTPISSIRHTGSFADVHDIKPSRQIDVMSLTLDLFANQKNIVNIDICKIDVEGYEIEVLRGASDLLKSQRINTLSIEWSTRGGQENGNETTLGPIMQEMTRHDYIPIGSSIDWCKSLPPYINNNMLFMSRRCLNSLADKSKIR